MCNSWVAFVLWRSPPHRTSMFRVLVFGFTCLSACSVPPLTAEDLTGGSVDASAARADAARASVDAVVVHDAAEPLNKDSAAAADTFLSGSGTLTGIVVDRCTGKHINALVGIGGQHMCSFTGKGSFFFTGLPTGVELTLASAAPGYQAFSKPLVISAMGTPFDIALDRLDADPERPCDVPEPPAPMCSCVQPGCV